MFQLKRSCRLALLLQKQKVLNLNLRDGCISGTKDEIKDRPEFALMLDSIKKGLITKVFCFDQSRIERNNRIWNLFTYTMIKYHCQYYPGGKFLDLDIPENKLFTGILSLTNEFYATLTGQKVKLAHTANAQRGKFHGLTAYGYTRDENGYLQIREDQAEIVRRIFKLSEEGIGVYTIARQLNADGVLQNSIIMMEHLNARIIKTNQITSHNKRMCDGVKMWCTSLKEYHLCVFSQVEQWFK